MEALVIPGWAVALMVTLGAGLISWLVWLTHKTNDNQRDIAINTANDKHVGDELDKIYKAIEDQGRASEKLFLKLETKLDLFLNQEISFLKHEVRSKR